MVREVGLNVQSVIMEIANRLPTYAQIKWREQALDDKLAKDKYPDFATLVAFVKKWHWNAMTLCMAVSHRDEM